MASLWEEVLAAARSAERERGASGVAAATAVGTGGSVSVLAWAVCVLLWSGQAPHGCRWCFASVGATPFVFFRGRVCR